MIAEVYDAIELKLKTTAETESAKVTEIEASKDTLDKALSEAESRHSATTATVESCKATLAQCFGTMSERKLAVAAAQEAERAGNAPGLIVEEEHQALKCVLDEHLKVLKEGSWETGSAKRHLDALLPLATKLTDESLVTALPSTCIKPPAERSTFDNMVVDQLESSLTSKLTQLSADIETAKPAKAQRAADVEKAQLILKEAEDAQQKASDDTTSALSAQKDTLAVLEVAKSEVAAFKPLLKKAKEAADEAQAEAELFHDNCRQHFTSLSAAETPKVEVAVEPPKVEESTPTTTSDVAIGGC